MSLSLMQRALPENSLQPPQSRTVGIFRHVVVGISRDIWPCASDSASHSVRDSARDSVS